MTSSHPSRIAIVGAGVSGTLTAVHLARLGGDGPHVTLFERAGRDGKGLAYDTFEPGHLLNVRASNMSAFPDDPRHFERWLGTQPDIEAQVRRTSAGDFVGRSLYGRYLQSVLAQACRMGQRRAVRVVHGDVGSVRHTASGFDIRLADGRSHIFDAVVLAMGNVTEAAVQEPGQFANPWSPGATMNLDPDRPVLIRGTGLTMVDLVIALRRQGFHGRIFATSRRGLMPQVHAPAEALSTPRLDSMRTHRVSALMRQIRREVEAALDSGACWRGPMDSLRGITQDMWLALPLAEKARFLRHARPYWESHRHRIAPPIARQLDQEQAAGTLKVLAGHVVHSRPSDGGLTVTFRPRGAANLIHFDVQRQIMATGVPALAVARDGFVDRLVHQGTARFDPFGLGLEVDNALRVLDGEGIAVPGLWALGPLVRGVFWECVAVPDIRRQAAELAQAMTAWFRNPKSPARAPAYSA